MLTCVPRSKQSDELEESNRNGDTPAGKQTAKTLASQIKDMALKASGAYRSCNPCTGPTMTMTPQQLLQKSDNAESNSSASVSERLRWPYRRIGSKNSTSGRVWGKEMEERLKGISMGSGRGGETVAGMLSTSPSGRRPDPIFLIEENEPKEWVAQVEPGVLITFISLPRGGNHLKRIRFRREKFNKWQAQRWWQENYDKVMELYNVQRLNSQAFPLSMAARPEDAPTLETRVCSSSMDSLDHQSTNLQLLNRDSSGLTVTPKLSRISAKTEISSMDGSRREADDSGEFSVSNVSDIENEWVEQDEAGVYITIRTLPGGSRELRRVRFSREKFGEEHARVWWEENRARIHNKYL